MYDPNTYVCVHSNAIDFTIFWKCLNLAERQYQTIFILKFHQFGPCGRQLTDALMEKAELQILSAHMRDLASGFIYDSVKTRQLEFILSGLCKPE